MAADANTRVRPVPRPAPPFGEPAVTLETTAVLRVDPEDVARIRREHPGESDAELFSRAVHEYAQLLGRRDSFDWNEVFEFDTGGEPAGQTAPAAEEGTGNAAAAA